MDVLDEGYDRCLVVHSPEISSDALAEVMGPAMEAGMRGLTEHLEGIDTKRRPTP